MHVTLYVDVEPHVLLGAVEDSNQGVWEVLVLPYIVTRNAEMQRRLTSMFNKALWMFSLLM